MASDAAVCPRVQTATHPALLPRPRAGLVLLLLVVVAAAAAIGVVVGGLGAGPSSRSPLLLMQQLSLMGAISRW